LSRTGCTDSSATNYNSNAFIDDGSCTYDVSVSSSSGCTDSAADNYDSSATVDDGSCEYSGCTDSLALNYDSSANVNSNYCLYGYDTTVENVMALLEDLFLDVNNTADADIIRITDYTTYFDTELFTVLNKIVSPLYGEITANNDRGYFEDFDTDIYNDITISIDNTDLSSPGADMGTDPSVTYFISNIAAYVGAIAWFYNSNSISFTLYFTDGDVPPTNVYPDTYVTYRARIGYWGEQP
jgi:hypothetical protein